MPAATGSVVDVSGSEFTTENDARVRSTSALPQPQCTPMPLPALGTQMILQGNGTNVGTVISLKCPAKHKLVGGTLVCVMEINSTKWVGETYCKPMPPFGEFGFRVAVLASIVSSAIILLMSVAFVTCCLLDCMNKNKKERESDVGLWDEEAQKRENRSRNIHKGRNSNNNNNNNNTGEEQSLWDAQKPALCDKNTSWRFPPSYPCGSPSPCSYSPAPPIAPLPGYSYHLPLLQQFETQSEQTSGPPPYHGPPCSSCHAKNSGLIHISVVGPSGGLVWQYGAQESSLSDMNPAATDDFHIRNMNSPKEWSLRNISV